MAIQWNKVTWYSKLLAVLVFIATFAIAFWLGMQYAAVHSEATTAETPSGTTGGTAGAHCGGFIRNAPTCAAGYHCQLRVNNPDAGGTCVSDNAQ